MRSAESSVRKIAKTALKNTQAAVIKALKKDLGKSDDDEDSPLSIAESLPLADLGLLNDVEPYLGSVADDAGRKFVATLRVGGEKIFDRVNERAVRYAADRGAELITEIDDVTRREIADLISAGLEDNIGAQGIIDALEEAYTFSDERAELIARTEIAMANQRGAREGMQEAKALGIRIKKAWMADAEACEVCQGNEDAGAIDLDDEFPSGDQEPPAHPRCECVLTSEIDESGIEEAQSESQED